MNGNLVIAIPSKGRLQEQTLAFFERAGLVIRQARGSRDYFGTIAGLDSVEVQFRSASEIAREVGAGNVHLAITGTDLLHETLGPAHSEIEPGETLDDFAPAPAHLITRLGFGHANLVIAVPQAWLDVVSMADLADVAARFRLKHHRPMRVATKYVALTRRFLTGHGVYDYLIVESPGATEGAPAAGTAELIVDITSTGRTLADNGLKIIDDATIMRSQAALVASLAATWGDEQKAAARAILTRIAADAEARATLRVEADVTAATGIVGELTERFGVSAPFPSAEGRVILLTPAGRVHDLSTYLLSQGAKTITVSRMDYVFKAENPLYDALAARLG